MKFRQNVSAKAVAQASPSERHTFHRLPPCPPSPASSAPPSARLRCARPALRRRPCWSPSPFPAWPARSRGAGTCPPLAPRRPRRGARRPTRSRAPSRSPSSPRCSRGWRAPPRRSASAGDGGPRPRPRRRWGSWWWAPSRRGGCRGSTPPPAPGRGWRGGGGGGGEPGGGRSPPPPGAPPPPPPRRGAARGGGGTAGRALLAAAGGARRVQAAELARDAADEGARRVAVLAGEHMETLRRLAVEAGGLIGSGTAIDETLDVYAGRARVELMRVARREPFPPRAA